MLRRLLRSFGKAPPVPSARGRACIPSGQRIYVVGDIHGRLDLLNEVLVALKADALAAATRRLRFTAIFLGDYVDRGPDSCGVLDRLTRLGSNPTEPSIEWRFLEGNHEALMRAFLEAPLAHRAWLQLGGMATLASYGIYGQSNAPTEAWLLEAAEALTSRLPLAHWQFLDTLDWYAEWGDYAFAHAGVRPGVGLATQSRCDLLSIRDPFLSSPNWHGKRIVHGHTIVPEPLFLAERIGIDTGAYSTGRLTCLVLEDAECSFFVTRENGPGVRWSRPT